MQALIDNPPTVEITEEAISNDEETQHPTNSPTTTAAQPKQMLVKTQKSTRPKTSSKSPHPTQQISGQSGATTSHATGVAEPTPKKFKKTATASTTTTSPSTPAKTTAIEAPSDAASAFSAAGLSVTVQVQQMTDKQHTSKKVKEPTATTSTPAATAADEPSVEYQPETSNKFKEPISTSTDSQQETTAIASPPAAAAADELSFEVDPELQNKVDAHYTWENDHNSIAFFGNKLVEHAPNVLVPLANKLKGVYL